MNRPNRNINENQQKQSKFNCGDLAATWPQPGGEMAATWPLPGRYLAASWPIPGPALAETWLRAGHLAAVLSQPCRAWISDGPSGTKRGSCMGNAWETHGKHMEDMGWPGLAWAGLAWAGLAWPGLAGPGLAWPGLG